MPSSGVIPVESPAVLNADVTSNISCIKSYSGSNTHIKNVAVHKMPTYNTVIINAFEIFSSDMLRRKACADFFLPKHFKACIITKMVVVFAPPPVEPGEAPMNIRIHIANKPAVEKFPISYVENPAVLVVIL